MKKGLLLISVLSILFFNCKPNSSGQYSYHPPMIVDDGISVASLKEVNLESKNIVSAINRIRAGRFKEVHSLLILKDNKLVVEEYFNGHEYQWDGPAHHGQLEHWNQSKLHVLQSVTKSFTSMCIGIAIDQGYIENVQQSIFDYLPKYQHLNTKGKGKITIEHLLTMTSGLAWDEWGAPLSSSNNDIVGLWFPPCKDPITCILERPLESEPGTRFTYSGGNMIVLGEIIRNATKMSIDLFSKKYLFTPLKIDSSIWALRFENGVIEAAGSLKITPRAMAKIGLTFLNRGTWNGKRIISEHWVEKSATPFSNNHGINIPGEASGKRGYAYSWWTKTYFESGKKINLYNAGGWGGQEIIILPELNAVIIFTGGNYTSTVKVFKMLEKYILPSLHESKIKKENLFK